MKKITLILVLILIFLVSGCIQETQTSTSGQRILESAKVTQIIDGDTIKIESSENEETIRLLHANAAEKGEKCYKDAKERLKQLIENKTIWLERDMQDKDQYERALRYVFLEYNTNFKDYNGLVNLMLVKEGLATVLIIEPNMKYKTVFEQAMNETITEVAESCLFKSSFYSGCFLIEEFHYDAEGSDCDNPNDEYVSIKNTCQDVNIGGWTIKDAARHVYTFKDFIAKENSIFTLYSGSGQDTITELYWNRNVRCPSVWNNDFDTLFLRDADENLVLYYNY